MTRLDEYRNRKPKNVIKYTTVELYHSTGGVYRFVQNQFKDKQFTLESGAPVNPSELVTFHAAGFNGNSPSQSDTPSVSSSITVQRVGSGIESGIRNLQGFNSFEPILFTWREYLSDDTSEPVLVYYLYVSDISVSRDAFTIQAGDTNPLIQSVLSIATPNRFPGLTDL